MTTIDPPSGAATQLGEPLLSLEDLVRWTGIPKSTLYQLMAEDRGPRSTKMGRALRFHADDILAWFDQLRADRDARV